MHSRSEGEKGSPCQSPRGCRIEVDLVSGQVIVFNIVKDDALGADRPFRCTDKVVDADGGEVEHQHVI